MLQIGSYVGGKYKVLNVLGQGGMSTVYLAMNEKANKQWAIKEIRKDVVSNYQQVKQSLITETELLKGLSHPYLPSIVDVIEDNDVFLIVMDYIEGNTLERALSQYGAQPQEYVVEWGIQLCDVLEYLHTREPAIIYRDLKPGNVMLRPDGSITLIDFGIAREYKENKAGDTSYLGTRGYAAPEQFGGRGQTDPRTDIYCLGATLYHLVTGHNPSEPPYEFYPIRYWNNKLSPGLEYIINKCVQNNPDDRYSSCAEVMYDLQHYKELDKDYKRDAGMSVFLFGFVAALCVIFGSLSVYFHVESRKMVEEAYERYIADAKGETNTYEAADLFGSAIAMQPTNFEAYDELLDAVLLDDNLTKEEDEQIRKILITPVGNMTVEETLATDKEAYSQFAYRLGIAYFYCYEEVGNKQMASKWLQIATDSETLERSKQERALRLGKICAYYSNIGVMSKSGDKIISYDEYWNDLVAISEGNIKETDNATTALVIYGEVASQVYSNARKYLDAGVTYEEMSNEMDVLLTHIENDILLDPEIDASIKEAAARTQGNFAAAKIALDTAVNG